MKKTVTIFLLIFFSVYGNLYAENVYDKTMSMAERGDPEAQYRIGFLNENKCNAKDAVVWYERSAEYNFIMAQLRLGRIFYMGELADQDFKIAYQWYTIAADNGDSEAATYSNNLKKALTPQQLSAANLWIKEWHTRHKK